MTATTRSSYPRNPRVEDSEDDIEVLVFKDSHRTNNTMNSAAVNTNKEQSNKPTVYTSMKRKPAQKPLAPEERIGRASSREKTPGNHEKSANDTSDLPTSRQSLFGGPVGNTINIPDGTNTNFWTEAEFNMFGDALAMPPCDSITRSASPSQPSARTPAQTATQSHVSHTTTRTSTSRASTTSTSSSKVSKSNPTHIELFKTLSPSQKIGRRNKMNSIRNKLKEKTVDELTKIYNSTDNPDFRKLMSEVYYENCMERLDDWEAKL